MQKIPLFLMTRSTMFGACQLFIMEVQYDYSFGCSIPERRDKHSQNDTCHYMECVHASGTATLIIGTGWTLRGC
jgi:hypothetical protein